MKRTRTSFSVILLFFSLVQSQIHFETEFNSYNPSSSSSSSSCFSPSEICRSIVECSSRIPLSEIESKQCQLPNGGQGLCCAEFLNVNVRNFFPEPVIESNIVNPFSNAQVRTAFESGDIFATNISLRLNGQLERSVAGSASFIHSKHQGAKPEAIRLIEVALSSIEAGRRLNEGSSVTSFKGTDISNTAFESRCPKPPSCDPNAKYRNTDGSCNNLGKSLYGRSFTPNQRILPNRYFDGFSAPRRSIDGSPLPSARIVSSTLTGSAVASSGTFTNLLMVIAQFIDHDFALAPVFSGSNGEPINCCGSNGSLFITECFPIAIPPNDRSFIGRDCMNFVRSLPAPNIDCSPGPAEQMNQLTHWIDSSNVYGSTQEEEDKLRSFSGGQLRMRNRFRSQKGGLPDNSETDECVSKVDCFLAGDSRVNEQPTLAVMHTLFIREHNRIASRLASFNPSWSDEMLFKETRRIVNAEWQHIIFNEWLPIIIGETLMTNFGLWTLSSGYSNDYRTDFDPRITNEFAAAGFRFGHTLVPGIIKTFATAGQIETGTFDLRQFFNLPSLVNTPRFVDECLKGLVTQPTEDFDNNIADDLTDHLFETNRDALDLISLNIQRGRDHGIPGYIEYRKICKTGIVSSFQDLRQFLSRDKVELLQQVYNHVEDIDLFIGMVLENSFRDAFVGQTFVCIIADQFARLKKGDRFFYDLGGQTGSFTLPQLQEIRKVSIARLICDNSDSIDEIQPLAFRLPNFNFNKKVSCRDTFTIPEMNLEPWINA